MAMQSFRGAGGGGAVTVRSKRFDGSAGEHELDPIARELTAEGRRAENVAARAAAASAVVAGVLGTAWLIHG